MTAHVPMARVPFAPLDNPRLQHLASAKNRQNGAKPSSIMIAKSSMKCGNVAAASGNKRAYEPSTFDDFDTENVDPAMFDLPSKKTKGNAFDKPKPFIFSVTSAAVRSMPPPSAFSASLRTPLRTNMSSPRAPSTAPAGRSPKRKIAGMKSTRRISAPFARVDPPSFTSASTLPFSLDAALNGSLPSSTSAPPKGAGATIAESMPKNWFFEIYQDTPEEEASNLMEHSTLTLDLSSDDEDEKKADDYRGKENTPPEGYDAPSASRSSSPTAVPKKDIVRKKIVVDEMDDGSRSPLSDLETDSFIPEGLSKDSCVIVDETAEKTALDVRELFPAPVEAVKQTAEELVNLPVVDSEGDVKGEIIVWED